MNSAGFFHLTHTHGERELPQIAATTRAESDQSREPGAPSGSPTWVTKEHAHGSSSAAFVGTLAGSWVESWVVNWNTDTVIWDAGIPSGGLTRSTIKPGPAPSPGLRAGPLLRTQLILISLPVISSSRSVVLLSLMSVELDLCEEIIYPLKCIQWSLKVFHEIIRRKEIGNIITHCNW